MPKLVLTIRHGEKPAGDDVRLAPRGYRRAVARAALHGDRPAG